MKRIYVLFFCILSACAANAQSGITDTTVLRQKITDVVRTNSQISATNMKLILDGIMNVFTKAKNIFLQYPLQTFDSAGMEIHRIALGWQDSALAAGGGADTGSYHSITAIGDTAFSLNRPNGTKDTLVFKLNSVPSTSKVYRAILRQSGTSAPTVIVLENPDNINVSFSRVGTGTYKIIFPDYVAVDYADKIAVEIGNTVRSNYDDYFVQANVGQSNPESGNTAYLFYSFVSGPTVADNLFTSSFNFVITAYVKN